ncbi:MAG: hypothetical protein AABX30_03200 [Nanoarchaeota archaeon]
METRQYFVEIKPLEKGANPEKEYKESSCSAGFMQIKKTGDDDSVLAELESVARTAFINNPKNSHRLMLKYEKS